MDEARINRRIQILEEYLHLVESYRMSRRERSADRVTVLSRINRLTAVASAAIADVGVTTTVQVVPPPALGGPVLEVDVVNNVTGEVYGRGYASYAIGVIEKAIGAYEALRDDPELLRSGHRDTMDIATAIERSLRPMFARGAPEHERDVQDAIEHILRAVGARYAREKDRAIVGSTTFIPDFTLPDFDLALEVKLAKGGHGENAVQHEVAEDVTAFRSKWKRLLVVVYDIGAIHDPDRMIRETQEVFGVRVLIVKH